MRFQLSPIFIGLLGIMAGAMLVATCRCVAVRCCNRRRRNPDSPVRVGPPLSLQRMNNIVQQERPSNDMSRSEISLQNNSVLLEKAQECKLEGSCAVCLSEFNEGEEEIKVLPQCLHCFHAQCVNMWLYTQSNCPLCRVETSPPPPSHVISMPNYGGAGSAQLPRLQGVAGAGGPAPFRP